MKLRRLTLKNLNSLAGTWTVDFDDPSFSDGLFAITGPTGSGKTTLLDALCLALFRRTPRLGLVSDSRNEIMTRGTRECSAEVVFSVDGADYAASWSQKKTVRKGGGEKLQPPRCRFSRLAPDETVLAEKAEAMGRAVESVCHLDFERFTRTVVLPQGGFAAFLQADGKDRARLLEELTGGELYRAISREVYSRAAAEEQKLEQIRTALAEHAVMSDEERAEVLGRLDESRRRELSLRESLGELRAAQSWYERYETLSRRLETLRRDRDLAADETAAFAADAEALTLAERARTASDLHRALTRAREKYADASVLRARADSNLEVCARAAERDAKSYEDAKVARERLDEEIGRRRAVWERTSDLDRELAASAKELAERRNKTRLLRSDLEKNETAVRVKSDQLETEQRRLSKLEREDREAWEALELALDAVRRADLSELGRQLQEGKPCPLCGSVHHPAPFAAVGRKEELFHLREAAERARRGSESARRALDESRAERFRLQAELDAAKRQRETSQKQHEDALAAEQDASREIARLREERTALFGERDPAEEMERFKAEQARAEKELNASRERVSAGNVALARAQEESRHRAQSAETLASEIANDEAVFAQRMQKLGFRNEDEWRAASMGDAEIAALREKKEHLERREHELTVLLPQTETELRALGSPPEAAREGLEERLGNAEAGLSALLTSRGADEESVARDDEKRARREALAKEERIQEKRCSVWQRLNGCIGSAKGDKFSGYVQGLTFRRLVRAANVQLERMSERYRLKAGDDNALRLDVIDLWQGGAVRSSKNLSGGESFIVSLALALALSHGMKELKVDSLFLDEGFGSLDEESLETVLDCLGRLRESGKLVGVISHVRLLRERIDCRLTLVPDGSGHSRLVGPGCSKKT